jgi:hypothetical protein
MNVSLKSITRECARTYRIVLEGENHGSREFTLLVEEGEIPVLKMGADFDEYMSQSFGQVKPVLKAVMTFHQAQGDAPS